MPPVCPGLAYEGRAAPTTGEPTLADEEAKRTALTLPGEVDRVTGKPLRFLNVKLMDAPVKEVTPAPIVTPAVPDEPPLRYAVMLTGTELDLLRRALDDQCRTLAASKTVDQVPRLQATTDLSAKLEGLSVMQAGQPPEPDRGPEAQAPEPKEQPELAEHEQYRKELVERARKAYPNASPELAAKLDKEINRRVEMVRTYQG